MVAQNGQAQGSIVSGQVTGVNAKGIQLDQGQWFNLSNFAKGVTTNSVQKGQTVTLRLDGQGFIRAIEAAQVLQFSPPVNGFNNSANPGPVPFDRDRSIVLQVVMKAAVESTGGWDAPLFIEAADTLLNWYESRISVPSNNRQPVADNTNLEELPF